jgi:hypothetical protein
LDSPFLTTVTAAVAICGRESSAQNPTELADKKSSSV